MKQFFLGVLCTLAALAIGVAAYLLLGFAEVRGDLPPSPFETSLMTAAALAANSKAPLLTSDADFAHVEKQVTILWATGP